MHWCQDRFRFYNYENFTVAQQDAMVTGRDQRDIETSKANFYQRGHTMLKLRLLYQVKQLPEQLKI